MFVGARVLCVVSEFASRRLLACRPGIIRTMSYSVEERGSLYNFDYRAYFSEYLGQFIVATNIMRYA